MQGNPVGWFEIYVQDIARAKAFYENVFQLTLEALPAPESPEWQKDCAGKMEMLSFSLSDEGYGATGALIRMDEVPSGPGGTLVYFKCEDCAEEAARAVENGGSIFREKTSIDPHGFIAIVNDTEGNMIGLHSMK
ncbi:MAG: lactoylglutathione lyase [Thiothrix nivea]|nr:MAG: lactoylglutathione lyase [Thiothrix nivea]